MTDPKIMTPEEFLRYVEEIDGNMQLHKGISLTELQFNEFWENAKEIFLKMYPGKDEKYVYETVREILTAVEIGQSGAIIDKAKIKVKDMIGNEWQKLSKVPVGFISNHTLNAAAIAVPAGGEIIVLNLSLQGSLVALIIYILDQWLYHENQKDPMDPKEFGLLILGWVSDLGTTGKPKGIPWRNLNDLVTFKIATGCIECMFLFILLHEYAHILLGHLSPKNLYTYHPWGDKENSIKYYRNQEEEEFEADRFAAKLYGDFLSRQTDEDKSFAGMAVPMLFELIGLIEEVLGSSLKDESTHPPADHRYIEIYNQIIKRDEIGDQYARNFRGLFSWLRELNNENRKSNVN